MSGAYVSANLFRLIAKSFLVRISLSVVLFLILHAPGFSQLPVTVTWKEQPKTGDIVYTASCPAKGLYSIEVEVHMKGLTSDHPLPLRIALWGPFENTEILRLSRSSANGGYSSKTTYTIAQGNVWDVHPDQDHLYWVPFEPGRAASIFQGFKGSYSHRRDYAIDLDVEVGTPITAAREGIVIALKESSNRRCPEERCAPYGNYILIQHPDGTIGNYVHLQKEGVLVETGDSIQSGQLIGLSGNTGWSTGPHLHFDVSQPDIAGRKTIPFLLKGPNGQGIVPKEGQTYVRSE